LLKVKKDEYLTRNLVFSFSICHLSFFICSFLIYLTEEIGTLIQRANKKWKMRNGKWFYYAGSVFKDC
jgi:hypothetical protein